MNPTELISKFLELWIFGYKFLKFEFSLKPNEKKEKEFLIFKRLLG
jgi:hypothetical protein